MMPPNNAFASQALPSRSSASALLTKGVTRLEGTLKLTTAILALAAGVYTFLGVRELFSCLLLGSLMIVAMSPWLNASALAGAAAIQQHLAITVQDYTRDLDTANTNAIAAQGLLPDIQWAASRFANLADAERAGSLTGTAGSGTVVQLLTQMSGQLDSLGQQV